MLKLDHYGKCESFSRKACFKVKNRTAPSLKIVNNTIKLPIYFTTNLLHFLSHSQHNVHIINCIVCIFILRLVTLVKYFVKNNYFEL